MSSTLPGFSPGAALLEAARRAGLALRAAESADLADLRAIAAASFAAGPPELSDAARMACLVPESERACLHGVLNLALAENAGAAVGHVCWQLRDNGDVYLVQLAALPPAPRAHVPQTGRLLLAAALEHGLQAGQGGWATVNLLPPWPGLRDPADFYARMGYAPQPGAAGYRAGGRARPRTHRWMAAPLASVFATTTGSLFVRHSTAPRT